MAKVYNTALDTKKYDLMSNIQYPKKYESSTTTTAYTFMVQSRQYVQTAKRKNIHSDEIKQTYTMQLVLLKI